MESPKKIHEYLKHTQNIEDVAFTRLFKNYLQLDLRGSEKLIEIESTDQESVLKIKSGGLPFQGMIYTFIHINDKNLAEIENMKTGKNIQFHDFTPILFCTNFDRLKGLIKGINLNILPNEERLKFLEAYYQVYKNFLEKVENLTENNEEAINTTYRIAALSGQNPKLFEYFNKSQGGLFNYGYRSYELSNIRKFRMIEYEEWPFICFLNANTAFKKINLAKIYSTYYQNKNKTK